MEFKMGKTRNDYLVHYGMKGQKPGVFGASGATRYQTTAKYSKPTPNPNERKSLKDRIDDVSARRKAKNDAAYEIHQKDSRYKTKASKYLERKRTLYDVMFGVYSGQNTMNSRLLKGYTDRIKNQNFGKMTDSQISTYRQAYDNYLKELAGKR